MHGMHLFYIMRVYKNRVKQYSSIKPTTLGIKLLYCTLKCGLFLCWNLHRQLKTNLINRVHATGSITKRTNNLKTF